MALDIRPPASRHRPPEPGIRFDFKPFGTSRGNSAAFQNRLGESLVHMDRARDVLAVQLQVRDFMRGRETLTVRIAREASDSATDRA